MQHNRWMRGVALVVSGAMFMNCGGGGLISAANSMFALVQGQGEMPPPFTMRPGRPWLGRNPGRFPETRGGFYSQRALAAMRIAAEGWNGTGHGGGLEGVVAGDSPVALVGGMTGGGGGGLPGEGKSGGGMTGGGVINTANGNMMKSYPLVGWPSVGDLGIAFTVHYNSDTDYTVELGNGWSFTYGAKLEVVNTGQPGDDDIVIRWGDGSVVAFEDKGSYWETPEGCFDTLTLLGSGNYVVTTPDLMEYEFTPPNLSFASDLGDLVAIRDRNGNEIVITISTVSTGGGNVQRATKVEDAVTSRYINIGHDGDGRISTITDHGSRTWTITYNYADLLEIEYPAVNGNTYTREFTVNAWKMTQEVDLRGKEWDYAYDGDGRIYTVEDPLNNDTTYTYTKYATTITNPDATTVIHNYDGGVLASEVDEDSFHVDYTSYSNRQPTQIIDKNGKYWSFTYNGKGNLETATDPLTHTTTYTYEANDSDIDTITNHESEVWDYNYYTTGAKLLEEVIDPESRTIATFTYNAAGDIEEIKDGDNETTTITYDGDGYPNEIEDPLGNVSNIEFDTFGRVIWVEDGAQALTGSADDRTDVAYDEWGRQETITHPKQDLMGLFPRYTTHFEYDEEDNLTKVIDELGNDVRFTYDHAGRMTDSYNQLNEHEQYLRNSRGWVWKVINGRGKERIYVYTDRGDLYNYKMLLGGINGEGETYSYDGNGNTTQHGYYKWQFSPVGEFKSYEYDDANRLIEVDYATGSMTNVTFAYDDADRMIEMIDGTGTTTWDYWDDGQVKEMASPQGTMLYDYYTTTGRLQYLTEVVGGGNIVTTYTYDDAGRTETIDKFGETTTFEYDEASRPKKMIYDTGAYALYAYDGRSRIKSVEHKNSSNTLLRKETNAYDAASRITSRYEGPASGGVTTTFTYDDVGQLLTESASGYSASYTYDENGNRETRTVNGLAETYTVDDSDKLTSVTWSQGGNNYSKNYAYHWSGRPTSITYKTNGVTTATETMTWDKESRMLTNSLANSSYVYNGFDARVSKTVGANTTTFKRAGADPVSPVLSDVTGGTTTRYLPGISSRVGSTSTFNHSGIKNGILQTNSSQSNTATKRYDAFGNELSASGTWQTRFDYGGGFGYQNDSESSYKLLGHRYYDPEIGRFLTRDPIQEGRNWYAYCGNNPLSGVDPSGLFTLLGFEFGEFNWNRYFEDVGEMFKGYGDVLNPINKLKAMGGLVQSLIEDPLGTPGKVLSGFLESFIEFSSSDMRATGRATMTWLETFTPMVATKAGGACFVAGTLVAMADGTAKPIENVVAGDRVITRDQDSQNWERTSIGLVTDTFKRSSGELIVFELRTGATIEATTEHPFFVKGKGFVPAAKVVEGDTFVQFGGQTARIKSIDRRIVRETVYNFEVAGTHTYYVMAGGQSIWVHNQCGRISPKKLRKEYEAATGTEWPKTADGKNYDVSHKTALADGGTNELSNIEPLEHSEHIRRHMENGDFKRYGGRRKR